MKLKGKKLKDILDMYGVSRQDIAKLFGINASAVSQWMGEKDSVPPDRIKPISDYLGISLKNMGVEFEGEDKNVHKSSTPTHEVSLIKANELNKIKITGKADAAMQTGKKLGLIETLRCAGFPYDEIVVMAEAHEKYLRRKKDNERKADGLEDSDVEQAG